MLRKIKEKVQLNKRHLLTSVVVLAVLLFLGNIVYQNNSIYETNENRIVYPTELKLYSNPMIAERMEMIEERHKELEDLAKIEEEQEKLEEQKRMWNEVEEGLLRAIKEKDEAKRIAEEDAARQYYASQNNYSSVSSGNSETSYPNGGSGVLNKRDGINYHNGQRESYYSQRVLPGGGLDIPGRHVAEDGTVRDGDGYIVVASDNQQKGTVVSTSLGDGKVYDTGVGHDGVDVYTDW